MSRKRQSTLFKTPHSDLQKHQGCTQQPCIVRFYPHIGIICTKFFPIFIAKIIYRIIMKRLAALAAILLSITDLAAYPSSNHLRFRHINTEEGLSHNGIMALYQDSRGFIWMGSRDGLNLYNGESIRIYKYTSPSA